MNKGSVRLFLLSYFINTLGSAVTWTGLPVYLAQASHDPGRTTDLFLMSTLARLLFLLAGGWVADRFPEKGSAILLNGLSAGMVVALLFALRGGSGLAADLVLFGVFLLGALLETVENCWFLGQGGAGGAESLAAERFSWLAIAKVLGMSLGPLFFGYLKEHALVIDAASFALAALLQLFIQAGARARAPRAQVAGPEASGAGQLLAGGRLLFASGEGKAAAAGALLCGLLSFPLVNAYLLRLTSRSGIESAAVSLFWLIGGLGFVCSGFLIRALLARKLNRLALIGVSSGVLALACAASVSFDGPAVILACFALTTLVNPGHSILLSTRVFLAASEQLRGRVSAAYSLLVDAGAATGLLLLRGAAGEWLRFFCLALLVAVLARLALYLRIFRSPMPASGAPA